MTESDSNDNNTVDAAVYARRRALVGCGLVGLLVFCLWVGGCWPFGLSTTDFVDNTKSYKGKEIKLKGLFIRSNLSSEMAESMSDGEYVHMQFGNVNPKFEIMVRIPKSVVEASPNLHEGDMVDIEFICKQGSLRQENVAVSVSRHFQW